MESADSFIEVARVIKPLGLRGEFKVVSLTRIPLELGKYKTFFIAGENGRLTEFEVDHFRPMSKSVALKLVGLDDRDQAEQYRDCALLVRRDQLPQLEKGEYFIREMIGLQVFSEEGEELGTLTDVLELPAHDVYQIESAGRELLVPAISDFVLEIDLERRRMVVRLLQGLRDLA